MKIRFLPMALLVSCAAASAQTSIVQGDNPARCFSLSTPSGLASAQLVPVDGPGFSEAWRVRSQRSTNSWDIRLRCFNVQPVQANDTVLATFWMRTISPENGYGLTSFVVEHGADPWTKHAFWTVAAGREWKKVQVPFTFPQAYPSAGVNYNLSFWVTFDPQEIEIGGISVMNYGPGKSISELGFTWDGREAGAPWRKAAFDRIEKVRRSDIAVVVRDAQGSPVPGAQVKVRMKKHAFGWGTAVASEPLVNNARYGEELVRNFNKVVHENHLKWGPFETWSRPLLDQAFDWLRAHGITDIRGHNVIWPGLNFLPSDIQTLVRQSNAAELRRRIDARFRDVMGYAKGKVTEWDVMNEPYANRDVQKVLGDAEMVAWFKLARELDPNVKLYINDYDIVEAGGWDIPHINGYYDITKYIIDNGGPIDGIGIQGHFNMNVTPPARVLEILDRYATLGKDLEITEYDINIADEQIQADYTRDLLIACFSHPAMKSFLMWGFWEGAHWLPRGAMFRMNWEPKPMYQAWRDLVYGQWWTNADGTTGADGVYRTRGFLGDYDVEVTVPGQAPQTVPLTLKAGQPNYVQIGKQKAGALTPEGVVNVASYRRGAVAPGEMIEIWGTDYGPAALTFSVYDDGWSRSAGDVRLLINGAPAPLIHTLPGRVAAIVPYAVSGTARFAVEYQGTVSNTVEVPVATAAPGVFTHAMSGQGMVAAGVLQSDGTWTRLQPGGSVKKGQYVALYTTGDGLVTPPIADGKAVTGPNPRPNLPVTVKFGDVESKGDYNWAGLVYAGVTQVNAQVPSTVPTGPAIPVKVIVGGVESQAGVTIPIVD